MITQEWFWQEVRLLAKNNYGPWATREEAQDRVLTAINEVLKGIEETYADHKDSIKELVDEMMEGLEMQQPLQPPKCYCGAKLMRVFENEESLYVFDDELGAYQTTQQADQLRILCPVCKADVSELFPEGVCNYESW